MAIIRRKLEPLLHSQVERGKSILLLGPRQVGKTTLLKEIPNQLTINLVDRSRRLELEKDPSRLKREVMALKSKKGGSRPLILIDEIQKIPELLDIIQELIDDKVAQFLLTGSSARKLRRYQEINLLPGRLVNLRLDPLTYFELQEPNLNDLMMYGGLPGIYTTSKKSDQELDLQSYVESYLEEEIRAEAIVKKVGEFAKFLTLAGIESGKIINFSKVSEDLSVSPKTVASYFDILEDCLIAEKIEPITKSLTRKKLTRSNRYLMFDLGVRRACAQEGAQVTPERMGELFEQFVGLEIIRISRLSNYPGQLRFWRDPDGPEVDWIFENGSQLTPIEVKWTSNPKVKDIKNLKIFASEYKNVTQSYLICRCSEPQMMEDKITAIPWSRMESYLYRK